VSPVLAKEDCAQAFADTAAKYRSNTIAEIEAATPGALNAKAEELCKGGSEQQAEAAELLRSARLMSGERVFCGLWHEGNISAMQTL
jgi:hypothetical protein